VSTAGKLLIVLGLILGAASVAVHNTKGIVAGVAVVFAGILFLIDFRGT
jgi:hypothetical protein